MSVLNKEMHLKIILIIIVRSSAFAQQQECRAFVTQGSKKYQTVISLYFNENEASGFGSDIDNRLNTYEWNVQASTIIGKENNTVDQPLNNFSTSITQHVPCFLLAWKSANSLKNQLQKTRVNLESSGKVELKIDNDLVVPNIFYKIELKMIRYGKTLGIQCFKLSSNIELPINNKDTSYSPSDNHESNKANHLELVLIGPDRIFCNTALFINAFIVGNCTHATWKLKESPDATPKILEYQGSRLKIPENTLNNARTYEIICELKENDIVLLSSSLNVAVRKPKYFIRLQNRNQTLGANQPIKIIAHIVPRTEKYEIIWTCTYENGNCGQFSGVSTLYLSKGFSKTGLYKFDLTVRNIGFNKQLSAFVEVISINRSIQFDEIPMWVKPSEILAVTTHMMNIYSGCTLQWESIHDLYQDESFNQYMPLNITKTNYDRRSAVFVNRDSFLKELAAHSDDPGNQNIVLKIFPEALQTKQDVKYLLRCNTMCAPEDIIFADLEIVINASPQCNDLKVYPESGSALLTIFRFETTPAKDKPRDLPLTYSFGWYEYPDNKHNIISDDYSPKVTYFAKLQSFYIVETELPYIKQSYGFLGTVMLVCDNKDSCRTVHGPVIEVKSPESVSENWHSTIKNAFSCDLVSNNFDKFTIDMLNAFKSYKSLQNEMLLDDLQMAVNSYLNQKIKKFLDKYNKNSVHELISALTATEHVFEPSTEVLMNVVKLRGKLIYKEMAAQIVTRDEREALDVIKGVNDKNLSVITIQDIRKYFEATEFIITTSNDPDLVHQEKGNFITNMDKYLMEVCVLLYKDPGRVNIKFKLQTAYIVLEKFVNAYFRNFRYIPNSNNEWNANVQILLNQSWHMDVQDKKLCIGKAVLKDYLGHKGLLYYAQLFNNDMSELKMDKQPNTIKKSTTTPNKLKCSVYYGGGWKQCRKGTAGFSNLICMCNKLGFFKMENSLNESGLGGAESGNSLESVKGNSKHNNTTNSNQGSGSSKGNSSGNTSSNPNQGSDNGARNDGNNTTNINQGSGSGSSSGEGNADNSTNILNQGSENESHTEDSNNVSNIGEDGNTESVTKNPFTIGSNFEGSGNDKSKRNNTDSKSLNNATDNPMNANLNRTNTNETTGNPDSGIGTEKEENSTNNGGGSTNPNNDGENDGMIPPTESSPNENNGSKHNNENNSGNSGDNGFGNNTTSPNDEDQNNEVINSNNGLGNNGNRSNGGGDGDETAFVGGSNGGSNGDHVTNIETGKNNNISKTNTLNNSRTETTSNENGSKSDHESNKGNSSDNSSGNNTTSPNNEGQNNEVVSSNNGSGNIGNESNGEGKPDKTAFEGGSDGDNVADIETGKNNNISRTNTNGTDRNKKANGTSNGGRNNTADPESGDDNENISDNINPNEANNNSRNSNGTNSNSSHGNGGLETEENERNSTNSDNSGNTNSNNNINSSRGEALRNNADKTDNNNTANTYVGSANSSRDTLDSPGNRTNVSSPESSNNSGAIGKNSDTSEIHSASFLSMGDKISLSVIALCIVGTSGLILFGIISKRVRKVRAQELTEPPTYPIYADHFQKENMRGDF